MAAMLPDSRPRLLQVRGTKTSVLAAVALGIALVACGGAKRQAAPPARVAMGEKIQIGSVVHDEYFDMVHALHAELVMTKLDERNARMGLAQALGLLPDATPEHIVRKLGETVNDGPRVTLTVDEPSMASARVTMEKGAQPSEEFALVVKSLESTANAELRLATKVLTFPERAHRLRNVGTKLVEGASKDFADKPESERRSIVAELNASLEVMRRVAEECHQLAHRWRDFVRALRHALDRAPSPRAKNAK